MMTTDKLPKESSKAYAAFSQYCALGAERSITEVARKCHKTRGLMGRWSSKWQWRQRLKTYEAQQAELKRAAEATVAHETALQREQRRGGLEDEAWGLGEEMLTKAREMMKFPLAKRTVDLKTGATIIMPGPWRLRDAVALITEGVRLRRLAVGLPTDKTEHTGGDNGSLVEAFAPPVLRIEVINIENMNSPGSPPVTDAEISPAFRQAGT